MSDDGLSTGYFWVLLAYFCSIVFFFTGWFNGNSEWVNYGLFCFLVGLGFNISNKLNYVVSVLNGADIKYEYFDDLE